MAGHAIDRSGSRRPLRRAVGMTLGVAALTAICVATPAVAAPPTGRTAGAFHGLTITTLSNPRPQLISGERALVAITVPSGVAARRVDVKVGSRDVRDQFRRAPDHTLRGLVTGLRVGRNVVTARITGRGVESGERARLVIIDNPITGPVLSGPQQQPFYCQTTAFGLAPAVQPYCTAPTQVTYQYRSTNGTYKALSSPADRPADLAQATVDGRPVPYIVRVETGTIDRAVYQIAALYDGRDPSPYQQDRGWNGRLIYTFGGGCNAGYHQGATTGGVLNDLFLGQGYAVASSSLNVLDNNCSTIISAEAAMMVKEHFIDSYGPVVHTIGWGGSGGAIQQYDIADQYPGILDGIVPGVSFPDPFTTLGPVTDCRLLDSFFDSAGSGFSSADRTAIAGYRDYTTCRSWDVTFASRATATESCNPAIPVDVRWDPVTNPQGVKCNADEQVANQFGRDPNTGFVRSVLDNAGIQYGLGALQSGAITPAQFVDLNAHIGGMDYTGKLVAHRTKANRRALAAAYRDDLMTSAALGLRNTAIIDQRTDLDLAGLGNDIHTTEWSYVMRQRLLAQNGTAANQVIIETSTDPAQVAAANVYELDAMDRWLDAIDADTSGRVLSRKIVHDRPEDLADGCYLPSGVRIKEALTYPASGRCGELYPVAANPRLVAGENLGMTALKCRLRPMHFADYPVSFTAAEKATLRSTFSKGVCDYGRPGVRQQAPIGDWLSYGSAVTGPTAPTPVPGPRAARD